MMFNISSFHLSSLQCEPFPYLEKIQLFNASDKLFQMTSIISVMKCLISYISSNSSQENFICKSESYSEHTPVVLTYASNSCLPMIFNTKVIF